jgi:hypothetical protein
MSAAGHAPFPAAGWPGRTLLVPPRAVEAVGREADDVGDGAPPAEEDGDGAAAAADADRPPRADVAGGTAPAPAPGWPPAERAGAALPYAAADT